ncbi:MAG: hypothetical protein AAFQ37_00540 [Bacteroidota bacterium]
MKIGVSQWLFLLLFCPLIMLSAQEEEFLLECGQDLGGRVIGTGGFTSAAPGNTQCITFSEWDIDPLDIEEPYDVSVYYDQGFTSVVFTTENGASVMGTNGNNFSRAVLPNDGSTFICATVVVNNDDNAEDMGFLALVSIRNQDNNGGSGISGIDDEIFGECTPVDTFNIALNGNPDDLFTVDFELGITEIEANDTRTLSFTFNLCGISFTDAVDVEPLPGRPIGFTIYSFSIDSVPGDCDEVIYEFCSNPGEQSYGVPFVSANYLCIPCTPPDPAIQPVTLCADEPIDLTGIVDTMGLSLMGTWSTPDGTGLFDGGTDFATATTYTPSQADILRGGLTLLLTTDDASDPCSPSTVSAFFPILKVDCGTFPWARE